MGARLKELLAAATAASLLSLLLSFQLTVPGRRQREPEAAALDLNQLTHLLRKMEDEQLSGRLRVAEVRGRPETTAPYEEALRQLGLTPSNGSGWDLLLCPGVVTGPCVGPQEARGPWLGQVPGVDAVLGRRSLCASLRSLGAVQLRVAPPCFSLPEDLEALLVDAGANSTWVVKAAGRLHVVDAMQLFAHLRSKKLVVQEWVPRQLRVLGVPLSVHLCVLITSMAPLRAYVFREGAAVFRLGADGAYRKTGKIWPTSQLWRHVPLAKSVDVQARTDALLLKLLLGIETLLLAQLAALPDPHYRCDQCFQLLGVQLLYTATLRPLVMDVSASLPPQLWTKDVVSEALRLLLARHRVADELASSLAAVSTTTGVAGLRCLISDDLCLTSEDLGSLLRSRRESLGDGAFRRLYPSNGGAQASELVQRLQQFMLRDPRFRPANAMLRESGRHSTADLHEIATRLEARTRPSLDSRLSTDEPEREPSWEQSVSAVRCSKDESLAPYLASLRLQPSVALEPTFSPLVTDYQASVPHDAIMVNVQADALNCASEARFEHVDGPLHSANTTLGVGSNRIAILVKSVTTREVLLAYSLTVTRRSASFGELPLQRRFQACSLRQECEYIFSPGEDCGLQRESFSSWDDLLSHAQHLPACNSGDAFGRWVLPCRSCDDRASCTWSMARWQPFSCSHAHVDAPRLAACLRSRKLLFLGDSTNRGMLHYIMERLNGTLAACDKTHDIRVYSGLNGGSTALVFAYYPQFWLAAPHRPVFDKTLYQLLLKHPPLSNSSDTVIIVGGVHWLATQHLHMLLRVLRREGLTGALLVVKTLGSGFHIPAEGVHFLPKERQEKLLKHSQGLAAFAKHYHMEVVETFNITAARYKDFLQGKCACHFHKVEKVGEDSYHVHGPINALYSEILLSRLCQDVSSPNPSS